MRCAVIAAAVTGWALAVRADEYAGRFEVIAIEPSPDGSFVQPGDKLLAVRLAVRLDGQVWAGTAVRWVKLLIRGQEPRTMDVELFDDGQAPDALATDGVWTGQTFGVLPPGQYTSTIALRWAEDGTLQPLVSLPGPSFRIEAAPDHALLSPPPTSTEAVTRRDLWLAASILVFLLLLLAGIIVCLLQRGWARLRGLLGETVAESANQTASPETAWADLMKGSDKLRRSAQDVYDDISRVRAQYRKVWDIRQNLRDRIVRIIKEFGRVGPDQYDVEILIRRLGHVLVDHEPEALEDPEVANALRNAGMLLE